MQKVYACLLGEWFCVSDEDDCVIGDGKSSPNIWLEELNQPVHSLDYVNLHYDGRDYKISPTQIQIVTE